MEARTVRSSLCTLSAALWTRLHDTTHIFSTSAGLVIIRIQGCRHGDGANDRSLTCPCHALFDGAQAVDQISFHWPKPQHPGPEYGA